PDNQAGMGQLIYLVGHGHIRDHAAEHRDELPGIKQPVIVMFPQRCEVQKHARQDSTGYKLADMPQLLLSLLLLQGARIEKLFEKPIDDTYVVSLVRSTTGAQATLRVV